MVNKNSYLVIIPSLLKVGYDNQISVCIAQASEPVEIKFKLWMGRESIERKTTVNQGETRNAILDIPREFPIGAGELIITATGGREFQERRDTIIYDNSHVILVQTPASTYHPHDTIKVRVVVTDENLIPLIRGTLTIEIYDAARKLVGEFPGVEIRSGLIKTIDFQIAEHVNMGIWLVSATMGKTTSSVEILVSHALTPLSENGEISGCATNEIPLMPRPHRLATRGAQLTIELVPSTVTSVNTDVNIPVVGSRFSTVDRVSEFNIQLILTEPVEKIEQLLMSYVLMTNGRITLTGQFSIEPTKECQSKTIHGIRSEEQRPTTCLLNGKLRIHITRAMVPYSTLLVYTFQPTVGINVVKSYRFSVAGLFQNSLTLEATCAKLSFTAEPGSIVGLSVVEYDSISSGLSNDMSEERLLRCLTSYEQHGSFYSMPSVSQPGMHVLEDLPKKTTEEHFKHHIPEMDRRTISEKDEEELIRREQNFQVRYLVEKIFFGVVSKHSLPQVDGDDIYTTSNMGRLYSQEMRHSPSSNDYHRFETSLNQYDVSVGENMEAVATSTPKKPMHSTPKRREGEEMKEYPEFGTPSWYEKMHLKLKDFSEEAFIFMQSGLTIITDFDSLRIPTVMKGENLAKLFTQLHEPSMLFGEDESLSVRDEARLLLEKYIARPNSQLMPPPMMLEEQSRIGYHRSLLFDTRDIKSTDTVEVALPPTKSHKTRVATGFVLNTNSGLSLAHPVHVPSTQGLYVLGCIPRQVRICDNIILTWSVNNYLGKDVSNVVLRIRASDAFDLMEPSTPKHVISMKDQGYEFKIPSLKSFGNETASMICIPKCFGLLEIIIEVESEFGGDREVLTVYVRKSAIKRKEISAHLFDLTSDKKRYRKIVKKIADSPAPYEVHVAVSGTGLDRFVQKHTMETNALVGIDRAIVCLYRSLGLRRYLNKTSQTESPYFNMTKDNITYANQSLQLFCDYDGSYSMFPDKGTRCSSLYLTSLAFVAMISPEMPFHDKVTLDRTLTWILSCQQKDGSFDDNRPCYDLQLFSDEFRRESLTAIVVLALTRCKPSKSMPECIRYRLFDGESSPIRRAYRYLKSRVPDVKPHLLTISLFDLAFLQNSESSSTLRAEIQKALLSRQLTVVPEDGSKYINIMDDKKKFHDQLLLNAMALSIYTHYRDGRTVSDIARWIDNQIESQPYYDTVLAAFFRTATWLDTDCYFRKQFGSENLAIRVNALTDRGEKYKFTINSTNMDATQKFRFKLPVRQITYSVSGFGIATVAICEKFIGTKQKVTEPMPFQLKQKFIQMPQITEIKAKTDVTYTLPSNDRLLASENFNRTIVMVITLPAGMRINEHQLGFFLGKVSEVMCFTYSPLNHKLHIYINVPTTAFGKSICLEWCLERLSTVMKRTSMEVRVFDYHQQERQLIRLFPIHLQPSVSRHSIKLEDLLYRKEPGS